MNALRPFGFVRASEVVILPQFAHDLLICLRQGWDNHLDIWVRDLPGFIEFAIYDVRCSSERTLPDAASFATLIKVDTQLASVRTRLIGIGALSPGNGEHFHLIILKKG